MKTSLTIEQVENGYILHVTYPRIDGEEPEGETYVVPESDGDNESLKKLLYLVAEHLGYQYNKYGKDNLNITFDLKGSKLE